EGGSPPLAPRRRGRGPRRGGLPRAAGGRRGQRDPSAPGRDYAARLAPAEAVSAGSEGLLFLPYLTGERTPYPDPLARGAFVGLTVRHALPHLTRAVLEGVAFGLRDSFELMRQAGLAPVQQVRVSGGGARSPLWRQILAGVLQAGLVTVNAGEGAAYGAGLLAGVGAGVWPEVGAACAATVSVTGRVPPQPEAAQRYQGYYLQYRAL